MNEPRNRCKQALCKQALCKQLRHGALSLGRGVLLFRSSQAEVLHKLGRQVTLSNRKSVTNHFTLNTDTDTDTAPRSSVCLVGLHPQAQRSRSTTTVARGRRPTASVLLSHTPPFPMSLNHVQTLAVGDQNRR